MSGEKRGRLSVRDTLATWPSLSVAIETAPWHWAWLPQSYNDWDCTSSCSVAWLFLKVEWFANRPLLPLERVEVTP